VSPSGRPFRPISYLVLIVAAVVAGAVLTGTLQITPRAAAKKDPAPPASAGAGAAIPSFADIAAGALPSVVSIVSTEIVRDSARTSPFQGDPFEFFFGPQPRTPEERKQVAGGSGFVISASGEILTNNHVVEGAQKIQVRLPDREVLVAKIVGADPATDVALIKITPAGKLHPIPLGDSDRLRVGDWVMAIGSPMTFEGTVTVGVVSAKQRSGLSEDINSASLQDFIQTDAAINFGNSGGPLVNVNGQVVGLATMVVRPAQNIGFAVPINIARKILPQLEQKGKVTRGLLGVSVRGVDQDVQQAFHLPSMDGAFVESVDPDLAAAKAGVKPGDAIVKVDGQPVKSPRELIDAVSSKPPGESVRLEILRESRPLTLTAKLGERKSESAESPARPSSFPDRPRERGTVDRLGLQVTDLTPDIRRQLRIGPDVSGVVVEEVSNVSPAADQGVSMGDVITEVNGKAIRTPDDFRTEVSRVKKGDYLRLYVRRFVHQQISRYVLIPVDW
jgi:serine protease Do